MLESGRLVEVDGKLKFPHRSGAKFRIANRTEVDLEEGMLVKGKVLLNDVLNEHYVLIEEVV